MMELVLPIMKYGIVLLEVGPEFPLNKEVGLMRDLW
jgi:hypothetical protein